jgi:hypothetical protein
LTITNPTAQPLQTDGGRPPPTSSTYQLQGRNSLQAGPSTFTFPLVFQ